MSATYPTTARILAERALEMACGQLCVDWAVGLLVEGHSGHYVQMLASLDPPLNPFEVADLRDRTLREMGASALVGPQAILTYARELLIGLLQGQGEIVDVLATLKDLCIRHDYDRDLFDFYRLFFAYRDLQTTANQWYWPGASRDNIESIVLQRAAQFVESRLGELPA